MGGDGPRPAPPGRPPVTRPPGHPGHPGHPMVPMVGSPRGHPAPRAFPAPEASPVPVATKRSAPRVNPEPRSRVGPRPPPVGPRCWRPPPVPRSAIPAPRDRDRWRRSHGRPVRRRNPGAARATGTARVAAGRAAAGDPAAGDREMVEDPAATAEDPGPLVLARSVVRRSVTRMGRRSIRSRPFAMPTMPSTATGEGVGNAGARRSAAT